MNRTLQNLRRRGPSCLRFPFQKTSRTLSI
ncbi:unnamed protein product [Strongylus vulgaris]|uniref:Uncharacterized protein n=1 Tax=Strongylus vulgaris TaxID=40348 RepID=A0A3P7K4K6_STRVU|nr:unnamed protein product [Strongylus vulgaris]